MVNIPDAAVQAFMAEFHQRTGVSYEANIRASLEKTLSYLQPVDVAAVRRQAFEEAATLIDEGFEKAVGKPWRNDGKSSKNDRCPHDKFMYEDCENCASAAIRALSAEPVQKD